MFLIGFVCFVDFLVEMACVYGRYGQLVRDGKIPFIIVLDACVTSMGLACMHGRYRRCHCF